MIYLGSNRSDIQTVASVWRDDLYKFLFDKRKGGLHVMDYRKKVSSHTCFFDKMIGSVKYRCKKRRIRAGERDKVISELNYFKNHFDEIVLADETAQKKCLQEFSIRTKGWKTWLANLYTEQMVKLYESFSGYYDKTLKVSYSHKFFRLLNIRTCPYCNRQFTFTLDGKSSKTSPEYDHFYDKADNPILAVSFYNLVPSCHTCNHLKGKKSVSVNPYFGIFESKFLLTDGKGKTLNKVEILKKGGGELELLKPDGTESSADAGNINTFGLEGLYSMHDDYVKEIVEKVAAYDATVQKALVDAFQGPARLPQNVYDFVWGKYLEEAQYDRRPLSKLTREMLEQMGIRR